MQILPISNFNIASMSCLGLLFDTDLPSEGTRSISDIFNDSLTFRNLVRTLPATAPWRHQYAPSIVSTFVTTNFRPTQYEFIQSDGFGAGFNGATRIIPRISVHPFDERLPATHKAQYNEAVASAILAHRSDMAGLNPTVPAHYADDRLLPTYHKTDEGWWIAFEYDFGAPIILTSLINVQYGLVGTSPTAGSMVAGPTNTWLQALVNDQWVDVINMSTTLRPPYTYYGVGYALPSTVTAQKFRVVNKTVAWPWDVAGFWPNTLNFYGKYASTKPRVLGPIKSCVVLNLMSGAYVGSTVWNFSVPALAATVRGRYVPQIWFKVTDDIKQATASDIIVAEPVWDNIKLDYPLPYIRLKAGPLLGRAV